MNSRGEPNTATFPNHNIIYANYTEFIINHTMYNSMISICTITTYLITTDKCDFHLSTKKPLFTDTITEIHNCYMYSSGNIVEEGVKHCKSQKVRKSAVKFCVLFMAGKLNNMKTDYLNKTATP